MLTGVVNKFPKWAKILLCIFGDAAVIYRLMLFIDDCIAGKEEKNFLALIAAIVCIVLFPLGFVLSIIDLISVITTGEFSGLLR